MDSEFKTKRDHLVDTLVEYENELYTIQKKIKELKVRESEVIDEILTLKDILGMNRNVNRWDYRYE